MTSPLPPGRNLTGLTSQERREKTLRPRDLIDQLPNVAGHPRNHRIIPKSRDFH